MATKAEVRNRTLEMLGVLRVGQSPQDQDKTQIDTAYDEMYQELKEEGLAIWAATGTVPDRIVIYVASLIALSRTMTYPVSDQRMQRILSYANIAKRKISELTTPKYESLEEPSDY